MHAATNQAAHVPRPADAARHAPNQAEHVARTGGHAPSQAKLVDRGGGHAPSQAKHVPRPADAARHAPNQAEHVTRSGGHAPSQAKLVGRDTPEIPVEPVLELGELHRCGGCGHRQRVPAVTLDAAAVFPSAEELAALPPGAPAPHAADDPPAPTGEARCKNCHHKRLRPVATPAD